jgi:hypothetical protein
MNIFCNNIKLNKDIDESNDNYSCDSLVSYDRIFDEYVKNSDPLIELLFALINLTPNDDTLGFKFRLMRDKIRDYVSCR